MVRLYGTLGWLSSSLGIALLLCSVILVPESRILANEGLVAKALCFAVCQTGGCGARPVGMCSQSSEECRELTDPTCAGCYCDTNNNVTGCTCWK